MTTMTETDVQADLNAVNDQLTTLVEELNKMNVTRDQLVTQIQNLNGVAMYLRGKLPTEDGEAVDMVSEGESEDELDRTTEHPFST